MAAARCLGCAGLVPKLGMIMPNLGMCRELGSVPALTAWAQVASEPTSNSLRLQLKAYCVWKQSTLNTDGYFSVSGFEHLEWFGCRD
jgi:hypothetical protein